MREFNGLARLRKCKFLSWPSLVFLSSPSKSRIHQKEVSNTGSDSDLCLQNTIHECRHQAFLYLFQLPTQWSVLNKSSVWDFLVAQMVKSLPAVQETWVQSLGWEDPLEKKIATNSSIPASKGGGAWRATDHRVAKSWTTEWLHFHFQVLNICEKNELRVSEEKFKCAFIVPNATIRWTVGNCWDIYGWVFSVCWMFHSYINNCSILPVVRKIYLTLKGKHVSSDLKCCQSDESHFIT